MTDTDRATERLAEAITTWFDSPRMNTVEMIPEQDDRLAEDLTAQGFGHREDHLQAFAVWLERQYGGSGGVPEWADRYLSDLASVAKEEDG